MCKNDKICPYGKQRLLRDEDRLNATLFNGATWAKIAKERAEEAEECVSA